MAKRFTDTEKWSIEWFSELSPNMKLFWFYICDRCDHAGIIRINKKLMSFELGFDVNIDEILSKFKGKITQHGDKLFIESFVKFQYGVLKDNNNTHKSVAKKIQELRVVQGLTRSQPGDQDKDKDNYISINTKQEVCHDAIDHKHISSVQRFEILNNQKYQSEIEKFKTIVEEKKWWNLKAVIPEMFVFFGTYENFEEFMKNFYEKNKTIHTTDASGESAYIQKTIKSVMGLIRDKRD